VTAAWRDRPVLVTGATGLLGGWLVEALLERGAHVVGIVRDGVPRSRLVHERVIDRIDVARGDVRDAELVERVPEIYGFPGALLALTLSTYPYVYLLALAALRDVDPSLEDAARSLGRSLVKTFFEVTLPALRPSVGAAALLVALYDLSDFGAVSLMQYDSLTRSICPGHGWLPTSTPQR
jgi:NAD(P)-dependent dehydrogenase (short-subunit alcohol dehydrogenase family)